MWVWRSDSGRSSNSKYYKLMATPTTIYSDLNLDLAPPTLINVQAVEQAIMTLISTEPGNRLFRPEIGGSLEDLLFEDINDDTAYTLRHRLFYGIEAWDNRIIIDNALSSVEPDYDNNRYYVHLVFSIAGMGGSNNTLGLKLNKLS